jgi:serine/threonine protein kinase
MAKKVTLKAFDGSTVEFYDEIFSSGAMKDAYWGTDKKYVVLFFRDKQNSNDRARLENIVGIYRERIFNQPGGDYWKSLFCWPQKLVEWDGKLGIVCPAYDKRYFFSSGKFTKGKEKEGKWFASAKLRNKFVEDEQKGTWLNHLHMCLKIARAVARLHAAGLAHSDLSYKNVLVDPASDSACIIDCDGLVVPGKFPPEVIGTPDFIAPEVVSTRPLKLTDPNRKLPSIYTDRHALAVLIYMYLLYRHPLRGGKVWDIDTAKDEELSMGEKALFIEHPTDPTNRPKVAQLSPSELPQGDPSKMPYTICGPYLKKLFDRAFIDGLHDPMKRPTAQEWVDALIRTADLVQPCQNKDCKSKWYVFDNTTKPVCPFCGTPYKGQLPILNFYYAPSHGKFISEDSRLMIYSGQSLYLWHADRNIGANEKLTAEQRKPVGDFHFHHNQWILINRRLNSMFEIKPDGSLEQVKIGGFVPLTEGRRILLSKEQGGRLVVVQLVSNS